MIGVALRGKLRAHTSALLSKCALVAALAVTTAAAFSTTAQAGYDQFRCASSNASYCFSLYEHHSRMVEAWYEGDRLPLAVGSLSMPGGGSWRFYADSGTTGRGYDYVSACAHSSCAVNHPNVGLMAWQNRHASTHTVWARDTF